MMERFKELEVSRNNFELDFTQKWICDMRPSERGAEKAMQYYFNHRLNLLADLPIRTSASPRPFRSCPHSS